MNWIDNNSQVDESAIVGNRKINCLLFVVDLVLFVSSEVGLQHALDLFSAACDQAKLALKRPTYYFPPEIQVNVNCKRKSTAAGGFVVVFKRDGRTDFNTLFIPILTMVMNLWQCLKERYPKYKRKSWEFCEELNHVTLRDKGCRWDLKPWRCSGSPLLRTERSHLKLVRPCYQIVPRKSPSGYTHGKDALRQWRF